MTNRDRALAWMNRDYITRRHAQENPGVVDDLAAEFAAVREEEREALLSAYTGQLDVSAIIAAKDGRIATLESDNARLRAESEKEGG